MRGFLFSIHQQVAIAYGILAVVILALVASAVVGSRIYIESNTIQIGDLHTVSQSVDGAGVDAVNAEIILGFGEMTVSGGADELLELEFVSNVAEMHPIVSYKVDDGLGDLHVEPSALPGIPNPGRLAEYRNEWDLRLHDATPLDLRLILGTGLGNFDLRGLTLTGLEVEIGTGEATVDLRGEWPQGFDTVIEGGTGMTALLLPSDVGVRVDVEQGIGGVEVLGLQRVDDVYVNPAYGSSDVTLSIKAHVGLGELNLEVRDDEETH